MSSAPTPENEQERLQALRDYGILDSGHEQAFDQLTRLASRICGTPISLVSLIDADRQWFKSRVGLDADQTPRDQAFCAHAIADDQTLIVDDARRDPRFADNPLVTGDPGIRFYAGAPLITREGHRLGTLCVIDREPRALDTEQLDALRVLADQVMDQIELRRSLRALEQRNGRIQALMEERDRLFATIAHDLRNAISGIVSLADVIDMELTDGNLKELHTYVPHLKLCSDSASSLLSNMLDWSRLQSGGMRFAPVVLDLRALLNETAATYTATALAKEVNLDVRSGPAAWVNADPTMIASTLRNLIGNAVKFTPGGKSVIARITSGEEGHTVEIRDEGIGMPTAPANEESLPESRNGTRGEKGSGLGLKLVRGFLQHHDASLGIDSVPGGGTRISFTLRSGAAPGRPGD
ncbi:MAG: sensor histidine kinase [Gammaproteobacteria bacterium]